MTKVIMFHPQGTKNFHTVGVLSDISVDEDKKPGTYYYFNWTMSSQKTDILLKATKVMLVMVREN